MTNSDSFGTAKLPSSDLEANVKYLCNIFKDDDTLVKRFFFSAHEPSAKFCVLFSDGMINNKLLNEDIIRPVLEYSFGKDDPELIRTVSESITLSNSVERTDQVEELVQGIVYGDTVLLARGCPDALVLNTKGWAVRSIAEPESERVLRGPREGFNESLLMNLSMLHRKLRTPDLKMKYRTFGTRSKTKACICYLDSLVNKSVLEELEKRLDRIDIDGTLDTNYIGELIKDSPFSAIKTVGSTERPDVVAGRLLEGRIALFLDGTPSVLTVPHLFIELFQSDEDYYVNFVFASIGRLLRILAFVISLTFPAIYVALVTFHQEMLPTQLLLSISASRQGVPLPTALETVLMLIVFEMLRESGARMPGIMGQTLSIVGALVVGQAAVDAKLVSAPIIIVVGLAGITGLMVPRLKGYILVHRFCLLFCACILGLYGLLLGIVALLVGIFGMHSFGVPIVPDFHLKNPQEYKDIYVRFPWVFMKTRPSYLSGNEVRQTHGEKK